MNTLFVSQHSRASLGDTLPHLIQADNDFFSFYYYFINVCFACAIIHMGQLKTIAIKFWIFSRVFPQKKVSSSSIENNIWPKLFKTLLINLLINKTETYQAYYYADKKGQKHFWTSSFSSNSSLTSSPISWNGAQYFVSQNFSE